MKQFFRGSAFFFLIFATVGSIFGIISASMTWADYRLMQRGIKTQGIVVAMQSNHDGNSAPVIEYSGPNQTTKTYRSDIFSSPPSYHVGQKVNLWYDPIRTDKVVINGFDQWFLPVFFGFFFLAFGGVGFGGLLFHYVRQQNQTRLLRTGKAVEANFVETFINGAFQVNGKSPLVVRSKWTDPLSQKQYTFDSENLWEDPSPYIKSGSTLTVYIEPDNPMQYYVDLRFLNDKKG
jgi:hypothetical protein